MSDLSQFELINASIQQAVDAISHAFVVYDANERFSFCNRKHQEWYAPIAHLLTPGRPLADILRAWYGVIGHELIPPSTVDEYIASTLARHRRASGVETELRSLHRWIAVAEHRMPDGGVVALRRDITRLKMLEAEVQDRRLLLDDLAELSYNWYWRQDAELRYVEISDGVGRHGRFDRAQLYGKRRWELGIAGLTDAQWAAHRAQLERREPFHDFTYMARGADGERRWFTSSGKPIYDSSGVFRGYHGIGRDITERVEAEAQIRESEARFKALTELTADWYWEQDAQFRFTRFEGRSCDEFFHPPAIVGKRRWELPGEPPGGSWDAHIATLNARQSFRKFEYARIDPATGRRVWLSVSGEPRFDRNGTFQGYRGVTADVTARKEAELKLEQLARYDELTGLANRHLLAERIQQGIALAHRESCHCAVLFIDLDRVRRVNNTLGHVAGDALITEIARRIVGRVRETDTVGRRGGDEFIVVLPMIPEPAAAAHVAKGILQAISEPLLMNQAQLHVTASIGISVYPDDGEDQRALIQHADAAMYFTKAHGRNGYHFYTPSMHERVNSRLGIEARLRAALERDQFELVYQPQISIATGRITCFEALLRWNDPGHGLLLPGSFIDIAEETGLILQIGTWVLNEACRAAQSWSLAADEAPPVAVNISALQFQQADLPELARSVLERTGLPPHRLELEVTETSLMRDSTAVLDVLGQLRRSGIAIAVDDFGSGYSSLGYLKRFPIDKLKIDQTFIAGCTDAENDAAITTAIIALGKALNLKVVAEGVETQAQLDFLRGRGCEIAQGFLLAEPLSAGEAAELVTRAAVPVAAG
jgi:diguanylate cyclase (GGDEF)-like protein/PAS domain S-box-containing protein